MTEDDRVENMIMNMPVEAATRGGVPRASRIGLKITPPPKPREPASNPPTKPSTRMIAVFLQLRMRSESTRPFLKSSFSFYCPLTRKIERTQTIMHITKNATIRTQSTVAHLSMPIMLLKFELPLNSVSRMSESTRTKTSSNLRY